MSFVRYGLFVYVTIVIDCVYCEYCSVCCSLLCNVVFVSALGSAEVGRAKFPLLLLLLLLLILSALYTKIKHVNIIRKFVPSVLLSYKMANKVRRCWYHWHFRSDVSITDNSKKYIKKTDKNNCKSKILYKSINANTSATWQHMLHKPPTSTHFLTANKNNNNKKQELAFRKMEV